MANDVAMRWRNKSSATINTTLQLLVIDKLAGTIRSAW